MKSFLESFSAPPEKPETAYQSLQNIQRLYNERSGDKQRSEGSRTRIKDIVLPEEIKKSLKLDLMDHVEISPNAIALLERYANFVKNVKSFESREIKNLSADDRSSLIADRQKKTLDSLSDEQIDTIRYYAKNGHMFMNDYCQPEGRKKFYYHFHEQDEVSKHIQTMDDTLKDVKLLMNLVLKKDVTFDRLSQGIVSDKPLAVGQIWVDSGFVSTSHAHDRLYPLPFYDSNQPARIFINAPKNAPGLLIESLLNSKEHEIILPRNNAIQFNEILTLDTSQLDKKERNALSWLPVYTIKASFIGMRGK
jgi:hypothetical protein